MSNGDLNWITNFIWGIADDALRDLYVRGKYRDVILPMIVLRRLDAVLEPAKQAVLTMKENLDNAGNIVVPVPGYQEQLEIVNSIEEQSRELNTAIIKIENEIALIIEFRGCLTADAVTGKLDVQLAAARLPEMIEFQPIGNLADDDNFEHAIADCENEEIAA